MADENRGAYIAAVIVVIIIILLLVFFFLSGSGCGSNLIPCLKACRICATADSNQIQLGPCCKAKITNTVGQETVYTLPDPGAATASFLLSEGTGQTLNGNALVTSSGGTGTVASDAVTVNGSSGVISAALGALGVNANLTDIVFTNSSLTATSPVLLTINVPSAPTDAAPIVYLVSQGAGTATIRVRNVGTAVFSGQTAAITFLVLPA